MSFEDATGRRFEGKTLRDIMIFYYLTLDALNVGDFDLSWDEFMDVCDEDPSIPRKMERIIEKYLEIQKTADEDGEGQSKTSQKKN